VWWTGTPKNIDEVDRREVCGNVYPYTVTDDRVGRNKKRKDNGKDFFPTRLYWEI
jgi:hypothetical protein